MSEKKNDMQSRRALLQLALRGTAVAGIAEMLPRTARAEVPVERAAVCIYLIGGNDSNNMIVPLEDSAYSTYASARGELALSRNILLPVNSSRLNGGFGFHPMMGEIRDLYQQGSLAVLANTGTLDAPMTRDQARTSLSEKMFQHQSAAYVKYLPEGRMMQPWAPAVQENDLRDPGPQIYGLGGVAFMSPQRIHISGPSGENPVVQDAVKRARIDTPFPATTLGSQLQRIALVLKASGKLGLKRPIFAATMPGFDTHFDELAKQGPLFAELSQAMGAFFAATQELGIASQVVTYTQTEFNRTLLPNQRHGTEHAWGGHELIMGGAVRGGDIYGRFPSLQPGGPDDVTSSGIWVPTTSSQQYEATIAYWHGVSQGDLSGAVDGIQRFGTADLGFLS